MKKPYCLFIPIVVVFLLFSCEPEMILDVSKSGSIQTNDPGVDAINDRMGISSAEEIPGVIEILENLTAVRSKASKTIKHKDTFIQTDKIKWIKSKKTELTNYTFPLVVRGQDEFEFYNLIIGVDSKGKEAQSFVRRYEVFEWAKEEYRASGYDFRKFRGKYYTYRLEDFYAEETVNKSSLSAISADCPNEDTIGSGSDNPDQNTQLVGIDQHPTWGTPNNTSPTGQVSFNSNSTNIVVYAVGSYVNNFQTGTYQYQETVSTESQGYVNVGDGTLSAPVLLSNPSGIVGMTITTNWTTTSSGGTSGQCLQRITVTIYYANGTSVSDPVFNGFCADSGPTQKGGSITAAGTTDCPQDDEVIISDLVIYKTINKGLCLPKDTQAYEWIAANGAGTTELYNFMTQNNVTSCLQNTPARTFALEVAEALPLEAYINYSLREITIPCKTSKADLKKLFPNTSDARLQLMTDKINQYGKFFGIDSKAKLQHFLSQAGHESKEFTKMEEDLAGIKIQTAVNIFSNKFNPVTNPTLDPKKENPNNYRSSPGSDYVNPVKYANFIYADANRSPRYRLGNTSSGDGYKYRGRGIFQLTGKSNYQAFTNYCNQKLNLNYDFVANPDLIKTDIDMAVLSAMWFYSTKVIPRLNSLGPDASIEDVTEIVNGGDVGITERIAIYEQAKQYVDCRD